MQRFALSSIRVAKPVLATSQRRCMVARAEPENAVRQQDNTVFYAGNVYTEAEWNAAKASGTFKPAPPSDPVISSTSAPSVGALMAFDGPAPELVNGRLAMLGFIAALGAELSSGESVFAQLREQPAGILLTFITIAIATLIPLSVNASPESRDFGPFKASSEMINGRAAMLGIASLLVVELVRGGSALF